jgi:hypothetical protein
VRLRPLFITHYTVHGSGTSDGNTAYFAAVYFDF